MKFKALRKKDTKEFVEIKKYCEEDTNTVYRKIFTSELPYPMPIRTTFELIKERYAKEFPSLNIDDFELVEFEMFEANTIGADIRNKLTPMLNLIALAEILIKKEIDPEKRGTIENFINKEIDVCKISIKYIANLL